MGGRKGEFMDNTAREQELRYEYYSGVPVCMSPRPLVNHAIVSGNIYRIFADHLDGKPCMAFSDGVDVHLDDADKDWVIPDAMIVCNQDIIKQDGIYGAPDLVVEVLSPSTAKNDRRYKMKLYEKYGVREYWIVNTVDRSIEVYVLKDGAYELNEVYAVYPDYVLKKMTDDEKAGVITEFSPVQFPDMKVSLDEVFKNLR